MSLKCSTCNLPRIACTCPARYGLVGRGMETMHEGMYVLWSDFVALRQRVAELEADNKRLRLGCDLTLLFHAASPWDSVKRAMWDERMNVLLGPCESRPTESFHHAHGNIPATNEATTRNLCKAIRTAVSDAAVAQQKEGASNL